MEPMLDEYSGGATTCISADPATIEQAAAE
jgi:hypothetical protein